MRGLGTVINVVAIVAGGILGMLFGKKLKTGFKETLTNGIGVATLFIGIGGAMEQMLSVSGGKIASGGSMMMILSIALGAVAGELLRIEYGFEKFGEFLKRKTKSENDGGFVNGFVTASFTVCIGAMAIVGSIQDGILGDFSTLTAKSVLDFIIVMIMASSMGKGCVFSAIPVGILQGSVTLLSSYIEPIMTAQALSNLSFVGSVLIFCVGLNIVWGKKVKVANLLPSIVFAVGFAFLPQI